MTSKTRPHYLEIYLNAHIGQKALRCTECGEWSLKFKGDPVDHRDDCPYKDRYNEKEEKKE